ncbi:MAG TPA: dockerin type I domain-containing protein, partial [Lacipirellulaceae bacterium]|nr:dockerin type I domain-containing protein [Lacipirellulaceae bacterium]
YGSGQEITNNYFEGFFGPDSGNLKGGILLGAGTASDVPYAPFRQSVVANNTIVNTGDTSLLYGQFYGSNVSGSFIGITPYANEFKDNLIVNSAGQAIRRENNAPDVDNLWSGNVVWPTASGAAGYTPSGVIVSNPALQRDAAGMLVSTMWPNAGASIPYRPLTIWDVGPGSSYIAGLPGDFNRDGVVDGADLLLMQQHLGPTTFATAVFDGNGDGMVNGADFDTWRMQFGQSLPGLATMGVPEPGSLAASCLALAIVAASARGRRFGRRAR